MSEAKKLTRRDFLQTSLAAGTGAFLAGAPAFAQTRNANSAINVAFVGCGAQGQTLIQASANIPNINVVAVCDIWRNNVGKGYGAVIGIGQTPKRYENYKEMLEKEPSIDAVFNATPDFMHEPITVDALQAGKHVYCEKMMCNTIEGARNMVRASRSTGKLLQIGHQRRSNPRYIGAKRGLIERGKVLGRIINVNGQWNRSVKRDVTARENIHIPPAKLAEYGYANMHEFLNWRWYKKYGGGPISDLGAHQIDIYGWFLGSNPVSVIASGGVDYYKNHEWFDNVMAIYEFQTPDGPARAFYQVLTTTSAGGGHYEYFMGTEGALKMSELPHFTKVYREAAANPEPPAWDVWVERGLLSLPENAGPQQVQTTITDARESPPPEAYDLAMELKGKAIHQPHIENFLAAIRGEEELNCPGEEGFKTAVAVLKVNEAVEAGQTLKFAPSDFVV